jgi:hypothetical protein
MSFKSCPSWLGSEEVSLSLFNEDNDISKVPTLPSFDSSKDDDGENENESDNRLEVVNGIRKEYES